MTKKRLTSDGRWMSMPELKIVPGSLKPDTVFTVEGSSPWGSSSKYNVVLSGPDSYYTYKTLSEPKDDPWSGQETQETITVKGNDPKRLARYRSYVKEGEKANDYKSFIRRLLGFKEGGYLTKYASGGPIEQVMQILKMAAQELSKKKPGKAVQTLAQLIQDEQGSLILDKLSSENEQVGQIVEAVKQLTQMGEDGMKLQKGGCPCRKKLMKVGGKLTEIEVDCNDIPISFYKKGSKVIKGELGLPDGLNKDYIGEAKTGIETTVPTGPRTYYDSNANKWMSQTYDGANGGWQGATELASKAMETNAANANGGTHRYWDASTGKMMKLTYNDVEGNRGWTTAVEDTDFSNLYNPGFNYATKTYDTQENAVKALGQDKFNSYNTPVKTWGTAQGTAGNQSLGTQSQGVTAQQAVDLLGFRNAILINKDIYRAKRRAKRKELNSSIMASYITDEKVLKTALGNQYQNNGLTAGTQYRNLLRQLRKDSRRAYKQDYTKNLIALTNTQPGYQSTAPTPKVTNGYLNNPDYQAVLASDLQSNSASSQTALKKRGGWLNKNF